MSSSELPSCRSEFLREITSVLKKRRKGLVHKLDQFRCELEEAEADDESMECLAIRCLDCKGQGVSLHLWEDRAAQVQIYSQRSRIQKRETLSFHPDVRNFTPQGICEALKLSVGCPAEILRGIWEFDGEFSQK